MKLSKEHPIRRKPHFLHGSCMYYAGQLRELQKAVGPARQAELLQIGELVEDEKM